MYNSQLRDKVSSEVFHDGERQGQKEGNKESRKSGQKSREEGRNRGRAREGRIAGYGQRRQEEACRKSWGGDGRAGHEDCLSFCSYATVKGPKYHAIESHFPKRRSRIVPVGAGGDQG